MTAFDKLFQDIARAALDANAEPGPDLKAELEAAAHELLDTVEYAWFEITGAFNDFKRQFVAYVKDQTEKD